MSWLNLNLSTTLAALVVWGFLMAFLFNVLLKVAAPKKENLILVSSFIMFLSYFISDDFFNLFALPEIYITWFVYDLVTLCLIFGFAYILKEKIPSSIKYIIVGLIINSLLFLAMHIDIVINRNQERWLLWDIYTVGVNLVDFIMIIALIFNKDYLGIIRFSKFITSLIRKKALN
ncbi:hypothetical protein CJF42_22885 [Pseudoalteromonas sp. NBT06-2]|uniref:hypothetical protein n=1 Tax=Pseudoalteromonas sp. NBT06-2 TaxID=2025950 RepID=UPI000BA61A59|nr:hypothetical protein [Pseudoalteromonas sp. NBT06-2]PAJ72120.1 hypothetical protein CJF42_22885 [Pseudoalteromonas sp. NBT06-2]